VPHVVLAVDWRECLPVADPLPVWLVPDELWELVEPHLPQFRIR
jgi:hypothetical protein